MKNIFSIYLMVLFFLLKTSCVKEEKIIETKVVAAKEKWEWKKYGFDNYFEKNEIQPTAIFYNRYDTADILFSNHRIKWMNKEGSIRLDIDGDVFSLDKEITLNAVWGDDKDSMFLTNDWDEIKYYKFQNHEFVGIRMHIAICNGLGCSVNHFLWYDLKKKTKNYFGTFRTDNKLALYSFNNKGSVDYLSRTFIGDPQGATEMNFITELYSLNDNGVFVLQKDLNGKPYQIRQTTFPNDTTITGDKVTVHWFENIKE